MITLLLHITNQEPVKIDVEEMPHPSDVMILGKNPRDRKDKEVNWLDEGVTTVKVPWSRINMIQVLPSANAEAEFPMPFRND